MKLTDLLKIIPFNKKLFGQKASMKRDSLYNKLNPDKTDRFTEEQKKYIIEQIKIYKLALEKFLKNPEI